MSRRQLPFGGDFVVQGSRTMDPTTPERHRPSLE
jgi:hypothetical protein